MLRSNPLHNYYIFLLCCVIGPMQPGVLGWAAAGLCALPRVQPFREQRLPAAAAQPEPHWPAEGAGGLRPVEDSPQ